jgi:hypothetical protein
MSLPSESTRKFEREPEFILAVSPAGIAPPRAAAHSRWPGLGRILAFFGMLVLLVFGLDFMVNAGLRRVKTSDFGVTNRIASGNVNADIVISGSSRAMVHYDPRIIQAVTGHSAFNIGRNGSQTDMQLAVLKFYLRHNRKPALVVHNLDLFSFVTSREIFDPAQYIPYLDDKAIYEGVKRVYPTAWKWKYLPLYGYLVEDMRFAWITGLKATIGIQPREDHFLGFVPRMNAWTGDFDKYRDANPEGVRFDIEPQGIRDMWAIAELCRDHEVPLLLVYSPEYSEMQKMERNRDEVFREFNALCSHFTLPLWDFSSSAISHDKSLFYNSQHLNATGAEIFSREFARRLHDSDQGARILRLSQ